MKTLATEAVKRVAGGSSSVRDLARLLCGEGPDAALFAAASEVRRATVGDGVHLRALLEFSSHCTRACAYCGLRAENRELARYRMEPAAIVAAAQHAERLGYRTVVLQSGEDPWYTADIIAGVVREIKATCDVALTLCVGERPEAEYALWREAGADRYLLRIETSDPDLYGQLHPTMSFERRVECLRSIKRLGYEVGSGVLVGLPGQTLEMLGHDLLFLQGLGADMVGMGPFIPHPQTPLAQCAVGSVDVTLRMMALARLLLPHAHIVATTALGTLDPLGRERGLEAGGNVMMPNVTPQEYRALYEIYPAKICIAETPEKCRGCIEGRILSTGRFFSRDRGSALRLSRR
jgi:biotin synthase